MNYKEFLKLPTEQWKSCYLFIGSEYYLIDQTLKQCRKIADETSDFNCQVFELQSVSEMKAFFERPPLFSDKKISVLSDIVQWQKKLGKAETDKLVEILPKIPDDNCFFMVDRENSIDKRTKLYKYFSSKESVVDFPRANERELKAWVKKKFSERGKKIHDTSLELFIEKSGYLNYQSKVSLFFLETEIEKISSASEIEIQEEIIKTAMRENPEENIFKFLDDMFSGNPAGLKKYSELKLLGNADEKIFYMILRQARLLFEISYLREELSFLEVQKKLKLSNFEGKKLFELSKKKKTEEWFELFSKLEEYDFLHKTQSHNISLSIELLISKLSRGGLNGNL